MKTRSLVVALATVAALAGAQEAQAQRALGGIIGAGPTFPIGDGKSTGFHVAGGVEFQPALLPVGFRAEGLFQQIPEGNDHDEYVAGTLNVLVPIPMAGLSPYLLGGVGLYRHEEHHGDHTHGAHTDFGFNLGLGTRFALGRVGLFIEARYHVLMNGDDDGDGHGHSGDTFIPLTIGIRF
jgi:hypothetical protein